MGCDIEAGCLLFFISLRTKLLQCEDLLVFAQNLLNLLLLHGTVKAEKIACKLASFAVMKWGGMEVTLF